MKKTKYILFAAALAIASVACTREEILDGGQTRGESRTFTCSLDEDTQTRTEITKQGKTVWKEGDKILVSNGTESDTLTVDSKYAGQKYFEFSTTLEGKIYVVYPYTAAKEIKDGKFTLEVPNVQNGEFGSANIACAVAEDRYVKMKNVTAVLKFRIPKEVTTPVTAVTINSVDNNVAGQFNVDLSSGTPVIETPAENVYSTDVTVKTDGNNGNNFYATVIPGTYKAGFTMSAVTLDLNKATESKTTVSDKELKVNAYYDLGNIGTELKPLGGDGTAANPYLISNYAEFLVFTNYVNAGNTMRGQSVKLMNDIKGVKTSVGLLEFNEKGSTILETAVPFQGEFDGNGKTVTVNINNTVREPAALFEYVKDSAYIHDVTVAGNVTSTFKHASGLVGFVGVDYNKSITEKTLVKIANCKNLANVNNAGGYAGGIVSWVNINDQNFSFNINNIAYDLAKSVVIENCSNQGNVESNNLYVGGIVGYFQYGYLKGCTNSGSIKSNVFVGGIAGHFVRGEIKDCSNSGNITSTATAGKFLPVSGGVLYNSTGKVAQADLRGGAAGIVSYAQNVNVKRCENTGAVSGVDKVGGITGSTYWVGINSCKNSGRISATSQACGGISGWACVQTRIYDCSNSGEVSNVLYQAAGILGQGQANGSSSIEILNCENSGRIIVTKGNGAAGILGFAQPWNNVSMVKIQRCVNKGEISGPTFSGGIVGALQPMYVYAQGYKYSWSLLYITDCENHGRVAGTATGEKQVVYVGGILGGCLKNSREQGIEIENCLNTAVVEYADPTALYPNAGGIAGNIWSGSAKGIFNCYNSGKVGPATGNPIKGALYGGIIGYAQNDAGTGPRVGNSYYLDSSCDQMTGKDSQYTDFGCISAAGADGVLATILSYKDVNYDKVVDILNAWRNGNLSYYSWTTGPKFVYPSYSDFGSGDYDLGNGGQI